MAPVLVRHRYALAIIALLVLVLPIGSTAGEGKLLFGEKTVVPPPAGEPVVRHRCLTPEGNEHKLGEGFIDRSSPWSLPAVALPVDFDTTIHCLVLRFNFQYETTDDPNTTGRGRMDLSHSLDTLTDSAYVVRVGHLIDPPPHDSAYFDAHLKALSTYWEFVSDGKVHLTWDVYPPFRDSVYELPYAMNHYGKCDFSEVVTGLEDYFVDCLQLADTAHLLHPGDEARWDIDFSQYQAFFLFHAGSDGQSDIGFPRTCSDLFTGFIRFGGSVDVDGGTAEVSTALMMPETCVQDNRITALNAVMAHEFGHQLGLVDMYSSSTFMTQLGDFALMDNNGFGVGLDFGFPAGSVFGAVPVYPGAWDRAFLGFVDVLDLRQDTAGIEIVAAGMFQDTGLKVARVPISETEYYLLEHRTYDVDLQPAAVLADSQTSVIQGPVDSLRQFTGEYDFNIPGEGMLIYLVDEEVAALDYDGDGLNNFGDNDLQWWMPDQRRRFVTLIEADGLVQFGGYYRSGYGRAEDAYRDDRNNAFTPNTNPPSLDNSGNNSHVYITDIHRGQLPSAPPGTIDDRRMVFDFEIDRKADGFPVRVGRPDIGLSPTAADLDGDGAVELLVPAGTILACVTTTGEDFIRTKSACDTVTCPLYYDTVITSINTGSSQNPGDVHPVPVFVETSGSITANVAVGSFPGTPTLAVVGFAVSATSGRIGLFQAADEDSDARADRVGTWIGTIGLPLSMAFNRYLYVLTDRGYIYRADTLGTPDQFRVTEDLYHGTCCLGDRFVVIAGDSSATRIYVIADTVYSYALPGLFNYGPIAVDVDRRGQPEVVLFSAEGVGAYVTVDTTAVVPSFSLLAHRATGASITTNPIAGDLDDDGYPEILVGGRGYFYGFNRELISCSDFPIEIDDRYLDSAVISAPLLADIDRGGWPEIIFATAVGNVYARGREPAFGFPLSSGDQKAEGSNSCGVVFGDESGGKLGYLGGDGWFYAWEVDTDSAADSWPMCGGGPGGTFEVLSSSLGETTPLPAGFDDERFYNYPNPVRGTETTIRYFLSAEAESVTLRLYDMSGYRIDELRGSTFGGIDNEVTWDCADIQPGVYRCVIEIRSSGNTETAFTDIALVR